MVLLFLYKFFYIDVTISDLNPKFGPSEGGSIVTVKGTGFYESGGRKFKFESDFGEREMAAAWDRKEKCYTCKTPPLSWYFGGKSPTNDMLAKAKENPVRLRLTLNGQNWIWVGYFEYYDAVIERLSYDSQFGEGLTEEEVKKKWVEEEQIPPLPTDPEALKTQQEEEKKKIEEENEEFTTAYKRCGTRFYIWGTKYRKSSVFLNLNISRE